MRAVQKYYSPRELAKLLSLSLWTIRRDIRAREFGAEVCNMGSERAPDYRVPASGVELYLERRRLFLEKVA